MIDSTSSNYSEFFYYYPLIEILLLLGLVFIFIYSIKKYNSKPNNRLTSNFHEEENKSNLQKDEVKISIPSNNKTLTPLKEEISPEKIDKSLKVNEYNLRNNFPLDTSNKHSIVSKENTQEDIENDDETITSRVKKDNQKLKINYKPNSNFEQ